MKLIQLWRHGDPEGLAAVDARVHKARVTIRKLRGHREENHLGEHLRLAVREPRKPA